MTCSQAGGRSMSTTRQTTCTATKVTVWIGTLAAVATWGIAGVEAQRDRGVNQPGAAGNRGGADPGVNQPGAAGNRGYGGSARQVRAVSDPGLNQPGAAGNRGVDPGINQPGAAGNRR